VQERLIGALIPDALGSRADSVPAPMPVLPMLRRLDHIAPVSLLVSTSRMDRSGRIAYAAAAGNSDRLAAVRSTRGLP
jgi:hypothetical protein